jgi:hypothetical protein
MKPFLLSAVAPFLLSILSVLGTAQQPFLSSQQWVGLREEASGAAPYENPCSM